MRLLNGPTDFVPDLTAFNVSEENSNVMFWKSMYKKNFIIRIQFSHWLNVPSRTKSAVDVIFSHYGERIFVKL